MSKETFESRYREKGDRKAIKKVELRKIMANNVQKEGE